MSRTRRVVMASAALFAAFVFGMLFQEVLDRKHSAREKVVLWGNGLYDHLDEGDRRPWGTGVDGRVVLSNEETLELVWVAELELWVGKYEVTLGQFLKMLRVVPGGTDEFAAHNIGDDDPMKYPAVMVGWSDAQRACRALNLRFGEFLPSGYVFRLPTEEEWEFIASNGDSRTYPWGDEWPPVPMADGILPNLLGSTVPVYVENSQDILELLGPIPGHDDGWRSVSPVAASGANEAGIYGLADNVSEWCEGWFDEASSLRLLKGSDAMTSSSFECKISARTAVRGQSPLSLRWGEVRNSGNNYSGFRVVIAPAL